MKYSKNLLEKSIDLVIPQAKVVRDSGVDYDNTDWMKQVAVEFFKDPTLGFKTVNHGYAILVIRTAMKELSDAGFLTFGNVEESWD